MWNPIERFRQASARRRVGPVPRRDRTGTTTKIAIATVLAIVLIAALLDWRGRGTADVQLVASMRQAAQDPYTLITGGARAHRFVFLGDLPGAVVPKRFAATVIERLAADPGLDAVALPVDAELQPVIDRYLDSHPEDASILLARPRALREWEGTGRAYLDIYRTVWRLNQELGADRRIRIFAIDMVGWAGDPGRSPARLARDYAVRDSVMVARITEELLTRDQRARVLFFVDGLNALKTGGARVQTGGAGLVEGEWLAARLRRAHPGEVFTVLLDAPPGRVVGGEVAVYRGTRFYESLRRADDLPDRFGVRIDESLDGVIRPIRATSAPGITVDIVPQDYRLRDVADVYVLLGG
jgi:hypothetical protein